MTKWFQIALGVLGGGYVLLLAALVAVNLARLSPGATWAVWCTPEVLSATVLSLATSVLSAVLSIWVGVPLGYLLARTRFWGRPVVEFLCELPFVLPPLVVGLSLLLLFQTAAGRWVQAIVPFTYAVPGIVLAQFVLSAALATRMLRQTFAQQSRRTADVARVLGASSAQAFWHITLPEARSGLLAAFTLAWARSLGEFGPVLIFAGVTRFRTEVLPTAIFLELSTGNLDSASAISVLMMLLSVAVLAILKLADQSDSSP